MDFNTVSRSEPTEWFKHGGTDLRASTHASLTHRHFLTCTDVLRAHAQRFLDQGEGERRYGDHSCVSS